MQKACAPCKKRGPPNLSTSVSSAHALSIRLSECFDARLVVYISRWVVACALVKSGARCGNIVLNCTTPDHVLSL